MTPHAIDLTRVDLSHLSGHLRMGGSTPAGVEINANSRYFTRGGAPWYPIMGEFHFSRYPRNQWRDEILKMKAGGITVIATYVFWNYHEEKAGQFVWSGNRSLRAFIELTASLELDSYPRIGPWAHGEARNGGFPDWLLRECGQQVRRDDPRYLFYARRYYTQVAAQLSGLLWKDGGPIVGIQIENELADQPGHIATLKGIAREVGLDVPIYTMTGWGPAQVPQDEVVPVFGGYPDAFWDRHHDDWSRPCRKHYFFSPIRDDNAIGADLRRSAAAPDLSYLERYPYGTCELGGGMPPSYHRRPAIDPHDIDAIAFCKLGAGANGLGYYMYHGGTHGRGSRGTLEENQETGYPNDLAACSYDFVAPLGEFGQVRPHFHRLRRLHTFLNEFGEQVAPLAPRFPAITPVDLDDRHTPRWVVRTDGKTGFIFANTYQRIEALPAQPRCQFELRLDAETLLVPAAPVDVPTGAQLLWPFNFDLSGIRLRYATANLLCRFDGGPRPLFVFSAVDGVPAEFAFDINDRVLTAGAAHQLECREGLSILRQVSPGAGCLLELSTEGGRADLLILTEEESLRLWKVDWNGPRLVLSPAALWVDEGLHLSSRTPEAIWAAVYPQPASAPCLHGAVLDGAEYGIFTRYQPAINARAVTLNTRKLRSAGRAHPVKIGPAGVAQAPTEAVYQTGEAWGVRLPPGALDGLRELYLSVEYTGDAARAYLNGEMIAGMEQELIADDFYSGRPWEIGLRRFAPRALSEGLELRFLPLNQDAPVYIAPEHRPKFEGDQYIQVRAIQAIPEYEVVIGCGD
jgi:hypothetical protein